MRLSPAILALVSLSACTLDAAEGGSGEAPRAEEFRSSTVDQGLDATLRAAQTRGFSPEDDVFRGFVVEGSVAVHEVTLAAGSCYAVLAAASTGVRELDLTLFLADGTEGARDATTGRTTAALYCPVHAGTYYVTVRASAGSGLYGVRVAHGPTGLDVTASDLIPPDTASR